MPTTTAALDRPYHFRQIALHWTIVGLVALQFATGGGMEAWFGTRGTEEAATAGTAWVHGIIGSGILLAMLIRLGTRRKYGAPPPPRTEPGAVQKLSRGVHYTFYVVLIAMPVAGLLAVLTGNDLIATAHGLTSFLLLALIALHFAGALWHLVKRDGVVSRMIPGQE